MLPPCHPPFLILPITLPVGSVALLKFLARKNNYRLILPNRLVWFQPNLLGIHALVPVLWKARTAVRTRNLSLPPKLFSSLRHTMSKHNYQADVSYRSTIAGYGHADLDIRMG